MSGLCMHIRNVFTIRNEWFLYAIRNVSQLRNEWFLYAYKKRIHHYGNEWFLYAYKKRIHITEWVVFVCI